jgi:tetratricopeptide (TPR) repeat protein
MTRQELAEAVNDHVFRATGKTGVVDARHVGRWERGVNQWPAQRHRTALRAILNVATDAELGFQRPRRTTVDDVDRKTFIRATLGASARVVLTPTAATAPSDADLIEILSGPIAYYRRMESAVPSDRLSPAVDAHLTLASGLVRDRLRASAGFRILSEIAGLAAWLAADRGDNATARRRYAAAIGHAERTHHPLLVSYMTASLGNFAVETGDTTQGLRILRRASQQLDVDAPDSARAWLASLLAVAYAATGDRTRTISALRRADKLTSRQRGEPQWPWVFTFDAAKAATYQATALSRLGDLRGARAAYAAASPALTAAKPRALAQVEHAHVLARTGDVAGGCALAAEALSTGRTYGSERITSRIRAFRTSLPAQTIEAHQLDHALAALYDWDDG